MSLKVSVDLGELTFGDLYNFVDLARGAGIASDAAVKQVPLENYDELCIDRFELDLPNDEIRKAVYLAELDRTHILGVLDSIIENEGDARGLIAELKDLRQRLA